MKKIIFVIHEYNFFKSHRSALAHYVKSQGYHVIIACPPPTDHNYESTAPFQYYPLKMIRKGRNIFNELNSLLDIIKLYKKEKPDIVHHFTIKPVVYGTLAGKLLKLPKIFNTVTGLGYVYTNKSLLNTITQTFIGSIYKFAMRSKQVFVIFQNPDDREFFLQKGYTKKEQSTVILGSGVDTKKFYPKEEPSGKPTILFASRMLKDKGLSELLLSCELLAKENIEFTLRLCGDIDPDNFASYTEDEINSIKSKYPWIDWLGKQHDMPHIFGESNIVCLPSYREGVPLTLLEAMASGRAIVTTNAPGCKEVIFNEQNGYLVPVKDHIELYKRLKTLCLDAETRKKMGVASRVYAETHFCSEKINQSILNTYTR